MVTYSSSNPTILTKLVTDVRAGTFFQVVVHLGHYIYAMFRLQEAASAGRSMSSIHSFYTESIYTMIANWFAVKGDNSSYLLKHALNTLGLADALIPIDKLLDSPVGKKTFRQIVKEFRNTQVTHEIFKGNIQLRVARRHAIEPMALSESMQEFLDAMLRQIVALQRRVETAFAQAEPELYALLRSADYFTTVLPDDGPT